MYIKLPGNQATKKIFKKKNKKKTATQRTIFIHEYKKHCNQT